MEEKENERNLSGVNFINILRAAFAPIILRRKIFVLAVSFVSFRRKIIGAKAAHKMLMKLTPNELCPVLNYLNNRRISFNRRELECKPPDLGKLIIFYCQCNNAKIEAKGRGGRKTKRRRVITKRLTTRKRTKTKKQRRTRSKRM